ncbi:hypothetical protein BGZ61DRAFT_424986 [Ilyonectria robusta]|uniref:uncharacterized protein n=1 Tax=Ilyonectria robusta TaxID=1079257 RepID=UPI001E8DC595|nr:uncharacterized protein BGZ61DRAFT_424986 [Ilyonectria robusta]KAH8683684.1 hypothetical protein BGZ61DRAFT_424986 [Ilyonectria robusta]
MGQLFGKPNECYRCARVGETTTVHPDCYNLFAKECRAEDIMDRLWVASTWRYPWSEAKPLLLPPDLDIDTGIDCVAAVGHLPQLLALPNIPARIIWESVSNAMILRYTSVLSLARRLSAANDDGMVSLPLCMIYAWDRGTSPTIREAVTEPFIRLTIDYQGLKIIERLEALPERRGVQAETEAFVVEKAECFARVVASFKYGLAHLKNVSSTDLKMWDTPAPPNWEECLVSPPSSRPPGIIKTIEMRYSTGITLFVCGIVTVAIHTHTSKAPCASKTFERLSYRAQGSALWLYVPLSSDDGITAFGVRMKTKMDDLYSRATATFLFRFARSGDLAIGRHHHAQTTDFVSATSPDCTLIYSVPSFGISDYGVCPRVGGNVQITLFTPMGNPPSRFTFFSSGSLEAVFSTTVFYDEETGFCMGILIKYNDGTRRALGQCRLGVDPTQYCTAPTHLCHYPITHQRPGERFPEEGFIAEFTTDLKHGHNEEAAREWECCQVKGNLQFWFHHTKSVLQVVD